MQRIRMVAAGLVWAALVVAGVQAGQRWLVPGPPNLGLTIEPRHLSLQTIWSSDSHDVLLPLVNLGPSAVEVREMAASCDCATIEPRAFTLEPRSSVLLRVRLAIPRSHDRGTGLRPLRVVLAPRFARGPAQAPGWLLTGEVQDLFTDLPRVVELRDILAGLPADPVILPLRTNAELHDLVATSADPRVAVQVRRLEKTRFELHVQLGVSLTESPRTNQEVLIRLDARESSGELPPSEIRVRYDVEPLVAAVPNPLHLGVGRVGETLSGSVVVVSRRSRSLAIARAVADEPNLRLHRAHAQSYDVSWPLEWEGVRTAKVTLLVQEEGASQHEVSVLVNAHAVGPKR
jgi:hypothetical protein